MQILLVAYKKKLRNSENVSQPCKIILWKQNAAKLARWCQQPFTVIFLCIISICITIVLRGCNSSPHTIVLSILQVAGIANSCPESLGVHTYNKRKDN